MSRVTLSVILLAILAASGCRGKSETPADDSSSASPAASSQQNTPGSSESTASAPAQKVILSGPLAAMSQALDNVKSYRAQMTVTGRPPGPFEFDVDIVQPDRLYLRSNRMTMIVIGQAGYVKGPDGQWRAVGAPLDMQPVNLTKVHAALAATNEIKRVGAASAGGKPSVIYEARIDNPVPPGSTLPPDWYTLKIWVGKSDNLPYKLERVESHSKIKTTVAFRDYNAEISIEPPVS
jgi:hypothetical protein